MLTLLPEDRRALAGALGDGRLEMVLQPIIDLRDGGAIGQEGLLRVRRDGALHPPGPLFEEARRCGCLVGLELAAIELGLRLLAHLREGEFLSLNVSPTTVLSGRLDSLLDPGVRGRLALEIIESEPGADYGAVRRCLEGLRGDGVRVAMDDIGAGSASLHQLGELEPDIVKLDCLLTARIDTHTSQRAIARAMVGYAIETEVILIAEGLERQSQVDIVTDLGVEAGQGFLLGRPLPPAALA